MATALLALGSLTALKAATANPQSVSLLEDAAPVSVLLTGTGTGTLTYSVLTQPTNGVLTGTAPNLSYKPNANANGADSFTFSVTDSAGSATNTVSISVTAVNDAPVAVIPVVDTLAGVNWTGRAGSGSRAWQAIASSADGSKLAAVVDGGQVYTSANSGVNWSAVATDRNWQAIASSADGSKLVAVVDAGQIYTSTDSGANWTARDSVRNWKSVASSADGQNLVAAEYSGKLYTSVDAGVTWSARDSVRPWYSVASSSSGSNLVAAVYGGALYTSTDVGTNWVVRTTGSRLWAAVASSSNGQKLVAAEVNGFIHTSSDGGTNWTAQAGSGARFWTSVASSADGSELVASTYGGKLYTSADSGVTWVARDSDRLWFAVTASADGGSLAAVTDGGLIYTSQDVNAPATITVAEDGGAYTNATFFTTLSVGPANESSQKLSFLVTTDNAALFSVAPAISASGVLTFTTATNANGSAKITVVSVSDDGGTANGGSNTSVPTPRNEVQVVVTPVNDAPTQGAVAVSGTEDTTVTFTSANFTSVYNLSHPDSPVRPAVSYTIESLPATGVLKLSGAAVAVDQVIPVAALANLTYEPALNENGAKTFRVSVSDGGLSSPKGTNGALVTVTLAPVNDAPVAVAQSVTTLEDTAVNIALNGTDPDGNALTVTVTSAPTNGVYAAGVYTPASNFSGVDTIKFKVNDGTLDSAVETVNITVVAVNDAPVLGAVAVAGLEDTLVSFSTALFSSQYSDVEKDAFTSLTVATLPATGSLKLGGVAVTAGQVIAAADLGNLSYTPALNETGVKTFTVRASDGASLSAPTTVSVVLGGVNDAPSLAAVSVRVNEDATLTFGLSDFYTGTPATSKFSDPEGTALSSIKILSLPTAGTLKNAGTNAVAGLVVGAGQIGQLTYTRAADENGDATFTVSASDGDLSSEAAVVTVSVIPVNDAPSAKIPTLTLVPAGDTLTARLAGPLNLKAVAASADASKLAAVVDNGQIQVSTDSGATWTARESVRNWSSVAVSTNGQVMVASVYRGKLYVSTNTGATWDARDSDRQWRSVAVSTNGAVMAAVVNGGQVYVSVDSGTNWTARATSQLWNSVAVSADGSRMVASAYGGTLYTSVDKGTNWTSVASPRLWNSVASSPDGLKLVATEVQGSIWQSADGGASWTANATAGTRNWAAVTMSSDGGRILAAVTGGKLVRSLDGGASWKDLGSNQSWSAVAGSMDLKKAVVTVDGGALSTTADYDIPLTITVEEDSSAYTQAGFASAASAGPSNESTQTISYSVALSGVSYIGGTNLFAVAPSLDANGALSFVPAPNASGTATLTVSVKDNGGVTNILGNFGVDSAVVGSFTVVVTPVDDGPSATSQSVGVVEDTANNAITLGGVDPEGDTLSYLVVTQPANGTLGGSAPALTYTPKANYSGADSFTFKVVAGGQTSSVATVSITVTNVNDAPVASSQAVTTDEDTAKAITLAGTDVEGSALTYTVVTQPTKGTLSGTAPNLTYTPSNNYFGSDSFTFKVNDGTVDSSVATVAITVNSVNDIPLANSLVGTNTVGVVEDAGAVAFTLTGSTPEVGKTLTYQVLTLPTKGTLNRTGDLGVSGALTYTPATNQWGADSFTFKVNDGTDNSAVATVALNITNVNDAPSFTIPTTLKPGGDKATWTKLASNNRSWSGLAISTNGSVVVATSASDLLISSNGGSSWTTNNVGSDNYQSVAISANGLKLLAARGMRLYTANNGVWAASTSPTQNWTSVASSADGVKLVAVASDSKVHVSTNSGTTWSAVATVQAWEAVASSTDGTKLAAAVYNGLIYTTTDGGTNWTARGSANRYWSSIASSADGSKLAATEVNGKIYTSEDGGATWTARESDRAWSSIAMSADGKLLVAGVLGGRLYYSDDGGVSWSAKDEVRVWGSVAISADGGNAIGAVLDGALYQAAGYSTEYTVTAAEDTATTVAGFATEIYAGANESSQTVSFVLSSNNSSLFSEGPAISADGTLTFTAAADANGTALVSVYAQDNGGTNNAGVDRSASKTFNITVTPVNDAPVAGSQAVAVVEDTAKPITLTGYDAEGSALTYTVVRQPTKGTLSGTAPNLVYTPSTNANGADNFTFKVSDGTLESGLATVTIVIAAVNDAPVVTGQTVTTDEDAPVAITLGASDVEGDKLTYTIVAGPTKGELTGTAPNLVYVPNAEVSGTDSFTFKVNDGTVDSGLATVSITVNAVNDAPVAGALAVKTDEDTAVALTLQGFDAEGAKLTYTVVRAPANGVLSGEGASLEYMPNPDFNGVDSFTYKVNDGSLDSSAVTVAITVASVPDQPVALTQTVKAVQYNSAAVTLKAYDGDNDKLTYTVVSQPKQGTLSGTAPNLVYRANGNATGTDSFTFRVNDGTSDSGLATVLIVIGEASKLAIKSSTSTTITLEVRAPKGAVVQVENATTLGTWSATAIKVTGEGTDVAVPVNLQLDKSVPARFWRLNVLSQP